jgi:hypothetical protein
MILILKKQKIETVEKSFSDCRLAYIKKTLAYVKSAM